MQCNAGCHDQPSDDLRAVLDAVRATGMTAHPKPGQSISDLVLYVAIDRDLNPVELQAEVRAYAEDRRAG